jgi:hypothetical protein
VRTKIAFDTFTCMCAIASLFVALPVAAGSLQAAPQTRIAHETEHTQQATPPAFVGPNPNCTIIVPANPLSAEGLATPFELVATDPANGPCHETNPAQSVFVQAAVLDPVTGALAIYNPLVIDRGTSAAVSPVVPNLPAGAIVGIWFGYDGSVLSLMAASGSSLADSKCVNGTPGSKFSQYAYCNASAFFQAANAAIRSQEIVVPPLGMASDGRKCPSTRDFFIVDQDQSDNLPTMYLASIGGRTAQDTAANRALLPQASLLGNPSDNRLLDFYVDGALGCVPWQATDLADPGHKVPALALNELQARMHQQTPIALVPLGDPMAQIDGVASLLKVNLYRIGVDQPTVTAEGDADTARYCRQILRVAPSRLELDESILSASASPDVAAANSLFTFLAQRFVTTYALLHCEPLVKLSNPVSVSTSSSGAAVSATIDDQAVKAILLALQPSMAEDDIADSATRSRP